MSLLDRIIEQRDPGPVGRVNIVPPLPHVARAPVIAVRAGAGLVILSVSASLVFHSSKPVIGTVALVLYLVVSYAIVPQADTTNLGYLGYTDRSLRWTDYANRYLFVFRVLLWPGRFAVASLRDAYRYARGERAIVLYRRVDESERGDP